MSPAGRDGAAEPGGDAPGRPGGVGSGAGGAGDRGGAVRTSGTGAVDPGGASGRVNADGARGLSGDVAAAPVSGDAGGGHGAAAGDALAGPAAADPGGAATAAGGGAGNLADRFAAALEAVGGRVHRAADPAEAAERVRGLCGERPVAADRDEVLAGVVSGLVLVDDPWAAEFGLTTALAAAADTGTLALAYDRDHPRGTSLVPPVHIAVVPADRLVPGYADAVARLAALRPVPSGMQMISGPSSSGDIEMELVRGMHGPLALHVVLVGG